MPCKQTYMSHQHFDTFDSILIYANAWDRIWPPCSFCLSCFVQVNPPEYPGIIRNPIVYTCVHCIQFGFMTFEGAEDRCYGTPGFEGVERCLERCLDAEQPSNIQATCCEYSRLDYEGWWWQQDATGAIMACLFLPWALGIEKPRIWSWCLCLNVWTVDDTGFKVHSGLLHPLTQCKKMWLRTPFYVAYPDALKQEAVLKILDWCLAQLFGLWVRNRSTSSQEHD